MESGGSPWWSNTVSNVFISNRPSKTNISQTLLYYSPVISYFLNTDQSCIQSQAHEWQCVNYCTLSMCRNQRDVHKAECKTYDRCDICAWNKHVDVCLQGFLAFILPKLNQAVWVPKPEPNVVTLSGNNHWWQTSPMCMK